MQVGMFSLQLAMSQDNSDQQLSVVLQEVTMFYRRVADLVNNIIRNNDSIQATVSLFNFKKGHPIIILSLKMYICTFIFTSN